LAPNAKIGAGVAAVNLGKTFTSVKSLHHVRA